MTDFTKLASEYAREIKDRHSLGASANIVLDSFGKWLNERASREEYEMGKDNKCVSTEKPVSMAWEFDENTKKLKRIEKPTPSKALEELEPIGFRAYGETSVQQIAPTFQQVVDKLNELVRYVKELEKRIKPL